MLMKSKNTALSPTFLPSHAPYSVNVRGKLLTFEEPRIMGILNITPDSFYSGSRFPDEKSYLTKAEQMLAEGADILDIGGQSTRAHAILHTAEEEKRRALPAIEATLRRFPDALISIDTFYSAVAQSAIDSGACIVNDISAGNMDMHMIETVSKLQVPYIAMHMQGTPATMQDHPHYENICLEILDFFIQKVAAFRQAGIKDIIVDPGFGFGKNQAHNYNLLKGFSVFHQLGIPIMAGVSRKSMIWRALNIKAEEALNGTSAMHMLLLQQGVNILRVHDVKPAKEVIQLWKYYSQAAYFS